MAGSTGITGRQVKDESLTGDDIKDGSVQRKDMDVTTTGEAVITKIIAGPGITITETGADTGTGDVTITGSGNNDYGGFGANYVFTPSQSIGGDAA